MSTVNTVPLDHLPSKVLFQNKWRKKTKGNWLNQVHLETAVKTKVKLIVMITLSQLQLYCAKGLNNKTLYQMAESMFL